MFRRLIPSQTSNGALTSFLLIFYITSSVFYTVATSGHGERRGRAKFSYLMDTVNKQCPIMDDWDVTATPPKVRKTQNVEIAYSRTGEHETKHTEDNVKVVLERLMRDILNVADDVAPIEQYLYKMLEYYKERAGSGFAALNIVGSTGNKLYVPERDSCGYYRLEVDVLFENPLEGMVIPVLGERPVVAWFATDTLDNSLPLGSVVLRLERYDGQFGSDFEEREWLHKHVESGKFLLSSMHYWGVTSSHKSILGEREVLVHPSPLLQPLFKTFKSERKSLLLGGQNYEFTILMDKVISVRIPWPSEAAEFGTRPRKWPESSVIKKVITDGCHLVHNPHNRGGTYFLEWKYTFSTSEQEIVLNFTPFQRSLFLVIKQMKRLYLDYGTSEIGEPLAGLTTYHLKTIMLWLSERLDPTLWETSPHKCFIMFFRDLEKCLDTGVCSHYFIPKINVMQSAWSPKMLQMHEHVWLEQNGSVREKLLETVRDIIVRPERYLTDALLTAIDSKHVMEAKKEPVRTKGHGNLYVELDILDQAIVKLNDQRAVRELNGT